jgi:hypothetical protein
MLSASDIAFYREQGYLVVPDVLDATTLDTARREMARILEGARTVTTHTDMYDLEPGHRPDDPRVRRAVASRRLVRSARVSLRKVKSPTQVRMPRDFMVFSWKA